MTNIVWEGSLCAIPKEFWNNEVISSGRSLAQLEKGIDAFYLTMKKSPPKIKTLEQKKIDRLYELLNALDAQTEAEQIAALKWAIFELENQYCDYQ